MAHLRMNACHAPTVNVFPEDVCPVCTFKSLCTSTNCSAGTMKHGAFELGKGTANVKGGGGAAPRYVALARTLTLWKLCCMHTCMLPAPRFVSLFKW